MTKSKWFLTFKKNPYAKIRLLCFHHSGGGASTYFPWSKQLSSVIELTCIQLPGREDRFSEPFIDNIEEIMHKLTMEFSRYRDMPFIIFGHSFGALLSFEFAKSVKKAYSFIPRHIIVSATKAPHLPLRRKDLSKLDPANLKTELILYNGIEKEIIDNEEMFNLFSPILRNDFLLYEKYEYLESSPFSCDMLALSGIFDESVKEEEVIAWSRHTQGKFKHMSFSGGHFFIKQYQKEILRIINQIAENQCAVIATDF